MIIRFNFPVRLLEILDMPLNSSDRFNAVAVYNKEVHQHNIRKWCWQKRVEYFIEEANS